MKNILMALVLCGGLIFSGAAHAQAGVENVTVANAPPDNIAKQALTSIRPPYGSTTVIVLPDNAKVTNIRPPPPVQPVPPMMPINNPSDTALNPNPAGSP